MHKLEKSPLTVLAAALAATVLIYGCSKEESAPPPAAPAEQAAATIDSEATTPAETATPAAEGEMQQQAEATPPAESAAPAATTEAPAPAAAAGDAAAGKATYDSVCASCHATGVAGAPKFGDKDAWAPRIATGMDAMMNTVMNGKGAMPPRGACPNCSDDDLKNAVAYMTGAAK